MKEIKYYCDLCSSEIKGKQIFKHSLKLSGVALISRDICIQCMTDKLEVPIERINFFIEFKCYIKKIRKCTYEKNWSDEEIKHFIKKLESKKIEIRNYGFYPLDDNYKENIK